MRDARKPESLPFGARRTDPDAKDTALPDRDPSLIPSLIDDPYAATIAPPVHANENPAGKRINFQDEVLEAQKPLMDSLLVVGESSGRLHFFMDGHYALGSHFLGIACDPIFVFAPPMPQYDPNRDPIPDAKLFVFASCPSSTLSPSVPNPFGQLTNITAASLRLPLLHQPWTRALARTSTTVRSLLIYSSAAVCEMRDGWMGTSTREGARGLGSKWLVHLEQMQAAHGDCECHFRHVQPVLAIPLRNRDLFSIFVLYGVTCVLPFDICPFVTL